MFIPNEIVQAVEGTKIARMNKIKSMQAIIFADSPTIKFCKECGTERIPFGDNFGKPNPRLVCPNCFDVGYHW